MTRPSNSRKSSSVERRASIPRRGSVASVDSTRSFLIEENNHEMFSGAASEIIPSSITSLHYPHHFGSFRGRHDSSRETSPMLGPAQSHELDLRSVHSNVSSGSHDTQVNFKFFSPDEIEMAQGGSTLENVDDPIDYNTNWDYSVDKYGEDEDGPGSISARSVIEDPQAYGSFDYEQRDDEDTDSLFYDQRRRTSIQSGSSSSSENQSVNSREVDSELDKLYPAKLIYQRYYLAEEDLVIGIAGYTNCWWKILTYYLMCIVTLGLGYLILRWMPKYRVNLMGNPSPLGKADWCVIENEFGELAIVHITKQKLGDKLSTFLTTTETPEEEDVKNSLKESDPVVSYMHSFNYRYIKFFYNPVEDIFRTNSNWYSSSWLNLKNTKEGVPQSVQEQRVTTFGRNEIEIEDKTVVQLLTDEILHPFYIFQVFSIFLWLADDYYYYASCIFVISMLSIINSLIETKSTIKRLKEVSRLACEVRVWRNGFWKQIDSSELVPGDVFEVDPSLGIVPCDALLINGDCVVNESMLTGESVPVTKTSATQETVQLLPENFMSPLLSKSFLYNGTKILKMKTSNDEPVTAMTVKIGFNTTKGSLVRSMLFPKPTGFKFYEDSFKYIGFMTIIAAIGFTYSTYNFIKLGLPTKIMVLRALDIITIVVPPALPATLTIGTTFAINRLKKLQIFCIAPSRVNIGGKLDVMCFDKTGTLTEDGLDILGVHLADNAQGRKEIVFQDLVSNVDDLETLKGSGSAHDSNNAKFLRGGMSTCHSLRLIDNELLGDPLDVKMFEFTEFKYHEDNNNSRIYDSSNSYNVVKEFEFISALRRMSVLVHEEKLNQHYIYSKGAPEVMLEICKPETLPSNYEELLYHYTHSGFRVIACGYKELKKVDLNEPRESFESKLTFTGFIIFENKLKESTIGTLSQLNKAEIRTIMCTGDNILTAISVGRECELISPKVSSIYLPQFGKDEITQAFKLEWEDMNNPGKKLDPESLTPPGFHDETYILAITGDVFRHLLTEVKNPRIIESVLMKCDIFARMSPDEKHELVEQLQKIDYTVGFCGDGANDCGALKAADVGISLSEAEASVAAPFTSRKFEISCVLDVIKEGRSSLVTSFSCFKFMSLYSAIQFSTVTILYKRGTNLGDFQFLYIDMFLILPLAIFMSWSKPHGTLVIKRPTANLVSPKVLIPLICHILVLVIFQILVWRWVQNEPWYIKPVPGGDDAVQSSDNTVLFLFTNFQYILISVVLSSGPPYRESMTKNYPFIFNLVGAILLSLLLFKIKANSWWAQLMQLTDLSTKYYSLIIILAIANFAIMSLGEEKYFGKLAGTYKRIFRRHRIGKSKKTFKNLRKEFAKIESV